MFMQLLDLLEHKSIFTAGYKAILHIHSIVEECEITSLISALDMKTKPPTPKKVMSRQHYKEVSDVNYYIDLSSPHNAQTLTALFTHENHASRKDSCWQGIVVNVPQCHSFCRSNLPRVAGLL